MDEVKAMTRAGETAGKAVAAGLEALRKAGHAGAEATAKAAKEEARSGRKRRRWPLLVAVAAVAAGVAYMRRASQSEPPAQVTPMPRTAPESADTKPADKETEPATADRNGQAKPQKPATKQN